MNKNQQLENIKFFTLWGKRKEHKFEIYFLLSILRAFPQHPPPALQVLAWALVTVRVTLPAQFDILPLIPMKIRNLYFSFKNVYAANSQFGPTSGSFCY